MATEVARPVESPGLGRGAEGRGEQTSRSLRLPKVVEDHLQDGGEMFIAVAVGDSALMESITERDLRDLKAKHCTTIVYLSSPVAEEEKPSDVAKSPTLDVLFQEASDASMKFLYFPIQQLKQEDYLEVLHVQAQELCDCYSSGENIALVSPEGDAKHRTLLALCVLLQSGAAFSVEHAIDLLRESKIAATAKTTRMAKAYQAAFSRVPHSGKLQRWLSALSLINDLPYGNQLLEQLLDSSRSPTAHPILNEAGAVCLPRLLAVYRSAASNETKILALRFIRRLVSLNGSLRSRLVELGVLQFFIEIILSEAVVDTDDHSLVEAQISCLGFMLSGDTTGLAEKLYKLPGGKDIVLIAVKWLSDSQSTSLKVQCAGIIWVLAASGKTVQDELRVAGSIPVLVSALSSPSGDLIFQAAGSIRNLCHRNPANTTTVCEYGAVVILSKQVVKLCDQISMDSSSSSELVPSASLSKVLISTSSHAVISISSSKLLSVILETLVVLSLSLDKQRCSEMRDSGGLLAMARVIGMNPTTVSSTDKSKASVIIRNLCSNDADCQKTLVKEGDFLTSLVRLFLEAVRRPTAKLDESEEGRPYDDACCFQGALWALVKSNPDTVTYLRSTEVLSACIEGLKRCLQAQRSKLAWERCNLLGILANLTFGHKENQDQVRSIEGGLEAVVKHLDCCSHSNDELVLQNAASAVHALCLSSAENLKEIADEGAAVLFVSLLSRYRTNELLVHHSLSVLAMLAEQDPRILLLMENSGSGTVMLMERLEYESSLVETPGPALLSCAKCLRLFAQHQKERLKNLILREESMQIITGAMKHSDESLLVELLMVSCFLGEDDFDMQREFRKAGGITRLVSFLSTSSYQPLIVKEMASKALEVTTKGNKTNQTFMLQKKEQARLHFLQAQGQGSLESVRGLPQVVSQLSMQREGGASDAPNPPSDPFVVR